MKIMFCIGDLRKGGAERVITNLSNELCKKNSVTILTTTNKRIEYIVDNRVRLISIDNDSKKETEKFILYRNLYRIKRMKEIILNQKPDIIVSFLKEPCARALILKTFSRKIKKIPLIISIRNNPSNVFNKKIDKIMLKTIYNNADGYVFQTEEAKEYFNKEIQERSAIIANPINPEFICERYNGIRENKIVSVGKLMKQKNHKLLIEAFANINRKYPEYKLLIYGEGELREKLEERIRALKLEDKILLKGNSDNIKKEIYKSKIFVMTSDYEGMPNALMEAMAMGIPCISTDCPCGGPKSLIENEKNGLLIEVGDLNELQKSIIRLIEDNDLANQISKNANKIGQVFTTEKINQKWIEYINKIQEIRICK